MQRLRLAFLLLGTFFMFGLHAQTVPLGINYQGVARDARGLPLANQTFNLRITLSPSDEIPKVYFQEEHRITSDELGLLNLVIGQGKSIVSSLKEVPWSRGDIWMAIEMAQVGSGQYELISNAQLLAVPYALYAETADYLDPKEELSLRNQSIYWATSGNNDSRPAYHYVGTRDGEDLVFKTNADNIANPDDQHYVKFTEEGQLQIKAGKTVRGSDTNITSYPVTVEGSNQGIYIKIDEGRSTSNNFVTFADPAKIWGTIEGQTYLELISSRPYIIQATLFALQTASLIAQGIATGAEAGGLFASIFGSGAGAGKIVEGIGLGITAATIATQVTAWIVKNATCVGVSYTSGSADYAEYLIRDTSSRDLVPAEVVGVRGGVVSLNTADADHYLVVSSNPILLGNMPQPENVMEYEKVAFMGQVPVRVVGPVSVGDYIIPSGNNDGVGIAVTPAAMKLGDYARVIGVAWEAAEDAPLNVVNTAIGINASEMGAKASRLNQQVDNIMDFLDGKAPLITDPSVFTSTADSQPKTSVSKQITDEAFNQIMDDNAEMVRKLYQSSRTVLEQQGFDFNQNPEMDRLMKDPVSFLKELRKNPEYQTHWSYLDQYFKNLD